MLYCMDHNFFDKFIQYDHGVILTTLPMWHSIAKNAENKMNQITLVINTFTLCYDEDVTDSLEESYQIQLIITQ